MIIKIAKTKAKNNNLFSPEIASAPKDKIKVTGKRPKAELKKYFQNFTFFERPK
jgi:hypothetical protein